MDATMRNLVDRDPSAVLVDLARVYNPNGWETMTLEDVRRDLTLALERALEVEEVREELKDALHELREAREARNEAQEYALKLQGATGINGTTTTAEVIERIRTACQAVDKVMRDAAGRTPFPVAVADIPDYVNKLVTTALSLQRLSRDQGDGYQKLAATHLEVRDVLGVPTTVCDSDVAAWVKAHFIDLRRA